MAKLQTVTVAAIVGLAGGLVAVGLQAKRIASKRGWLRVLTVVTVSLMTAVALEVTVHWRQLTRRRPPPPAVETR